MPEVTELVRTGWNEYKKRGLKHYMAAVRRWYGPKWKSKYDPEYAMHEVIAAGMTKSFDYLKKDILDKYGVDIEHNLREDTLKASVTAPLGDGLYLCAWTENGKEVYADVRKK